MHIFRRFASLAIAAAIAAASAAHAQPIAVPQSLHIARADGSIAVAQIVQAADSQIMLIVSQADDTAQLYFISRSAPQPTPTPPVPPTPQPQKLTIAIVEEPAHSTPQQAAAITNPAFQAKAKAQHNFLGIFTPDAKDSQSQEVPASLAPFLAAAKGKPLPWIMFKDAQGKMIWEGQAPNTAAELIETLSKFGG